jgi:hypothetical protein
MHDLHWPLVWLAFLGTVMAWLPLSTAGITKEAILAVRFTSLLLIYMTGIHMIGAPFPRYSIPMRPFLYGLSFFALYWLFLMISNRSREKRNAFNMPDVTHGS